MNMRVEQYNAYQAAKRNPPVVTSAEAAAIIEEAQSDTVSSIVLEGLVTEISLRLRKRLR